MVTLPNPVVEIHFGDPEVGIRDPHCLKTQLFRPMFYLQGQA